MADLKTLLKIKKEMKKKMPEFIRSDYHKKKRLHHAKWRRPRGITNKMRLQHKGHRVVVKKGYRTPAQIRGVMQDGKSIVVISNINDLKNVKKDQKVAIGATVGTRKRIMMIDEAKKLKLQIINYKDADKFKQNALAKFVSKKTEQKIKIDERNKKKEDAVKTKQKETKKTVDEKVKEDLKTENMSAAKAAEHAQKSKISDKKEKDKVLTQKD